MADAWSFRPGLLPDDASLKGYELDALDGHAGTVEWASYALGESYLMVTVHHHLRGHHHVVPAAAVDAVDMAAKRVQVRLTLDQIESLPSHHQDPNDPYEQASSEMLEGWNAAMARISFGAD